MDSSVGIDTKYMCPVCGKKVRRLNQHVSMKSKNCVLHRIYQYGRLESYFNSNLSLSKISKLSNIDRHNITRLFKLYFGKQKTIDRNECVRRINILNEKKGIPNTFTKSGISYEFVKKSFENEGYKLLSAIYINNRQKLKYVCKNGHKGEISWVKWQIGQRCAKCSKYRNRYDIEFIRKIFESAGYTLLSNKYVNSETPLKYICPKGHKHSITWSAWNKQGQRCAICAGVAKLAYIDIKKSFESEGYQLLTNVYTHNRQKLKFICPNGHSGYITWGSWSAGHRCKVCAGLYIDIDIVSQSIEANKYKLLSTYVNSNTPMHLICPNGHDYYVSWHNWNSKGYRCPRCTNVGTSYQETAILSFVKNTYDGEILDRSKSIISPYELDIVIPDKKIAIEYCGLYWHSELAGKDRKYHLNKLDMCNKKGYRLITIFEDEFIHKKDIMESMLKNKLGIANNKVIYARKCKIGIIESRTARLFCESNHIQGYAGSKIKIGLFYKDKLVSVMTFSSPSIAKGARNKKLNVWELSRFCSKLNCRVIGGASKLFKYFERNYQWQQIFSYADRRWSDGNLYEKLGFDFDGYTVPNYWYFKSKNCIRTHRFVLRKKSDEPKDQTEWQIRQKEGWNRIWDCGNFRFVKYK